MESYISSYIKKTKNTFSLYTYGYYCRYRLLREKAIP